MTYASAAVIINNRVDNVVVVDVDTERTIQGWAPEEGVALVLPDGSPAAIGWLYDPFTDTFSAPEEDSA